MKNEYYQNRIERPRNEARERYQNLSKGEEDKRQKKKSDKDINIFLRNLSRSYLSI